MSIGHTMDSTCHRRAYDGLTPAQLTAECGEIGLNLIRVGPIVTTNDNSEQIFQILFIIACVAIILMAILVVYLLIRRAEYHFRLTLFL